MSVKLPDFSNYDRFSYDTETTGLNPAAGDRVFGFSISMPDGQDFYYDIRETPEIVPVFNKAMSHYNGKKIFHNMSFDYRMSQASGINIDINNGYDTAVAASLINEHEHSFSLDNLARKYTTEFKKGDDLYEQLAEIFGGRATKNVQMKNISQAPSNVVAPYAIGDTRATLALHDWQVGEIERQGLGEILEFEQSVSPVLIESEQRGVRVDTLAAEKAVGELTPIINQMRKELDDIAGFKCNPQPSADIKKLFNPKWKNGRWIACDGTPLEETGTGNPSIGAEALRKMSHPAAKLILDIRSMIKTRDTFLVGHVLESSYNGRVYPTINQAKTEQGGTGTGRLSYTSPALQQIPDRNKKVAEIVKKVFLPEEGHSWIDADMASFEVRIFAHLVGTKDIVEAYIQDPERDFHQYVADLTNLVRNATYNGQPNAKQLNLSMIFNQGNGQTADTMGMPWEWEEFTARDGKQVIYKKAGPEALEVINKYHNRLPGVQKLAAGCKATAERRGYIFNRYGRHIRFPNGYKSYKASGLLIQSTAADENKMNWLIIDQVLRDINNGSKMLLNTHDSYSISAPIGEEKETMDLVKQYIEKDRGLRVPLILEVQRPGKNWWESKSSDRWL